VKEFTYMHDPWRGIVATDSQGVLDTLQEGDHDLQEQDVPVDLDQGKVVLDCLRPDWDILIEIQTTLKSMPRVKLQYVKGHQDKMTPYRALDLMGQLNVDADTQAGNYNDEFGAYRGSVIMSPLSRAHLNLSDGTVTSKYSEVMRYEATTKPLLEYIQRKNGWDTLTIQSIHWDAHALAIKNTTIPHTHLVKLLHKMLPTHALANKFDGGTRTCPLCGSSHEDFAHIIRCQHPSRAQWRNTFLTDLRDLHLQTDTSPRLSAVMLDGIRQWFRSPPCDAGTLSPDESPPALRPLIRKQNQIGWDQLFLGRFCTEWCRHQQQYFASHHDAHDDLHRRSLLWQASIIKFCWQQWYMLWKARNQDVHGHDLRTQTEASKREVRRQLSDIYRNRTMYDTQVQQLLHRDVSDHDQHTLSVTKNWLSANIPIFRESYRRVKQRALRGVRSIREYFGTG
jgi:hypothetical protein